jgi:hypothetical protein
MTDQLSLKDLMPGDIGFGPINGAAGALVGLGQLLLGDEARYRHAFVVVEPANAIGYVPDGDVRRTAPRIVEAMPSGARKVDATDRWSQSYVYVRLDMLPLEQRWMIADHAARMVGTPYGFSDYLALALKRFHIATPGLDRWISRTNADGYPARAICSQLVDFAISRAGVKVFDDGRLSQNVTPGALFYQLLRIGGKPLWPLGAARRRL